jgi:hypothetical protein
MPTLWRIKKGERRTGCFFPTLEQAPAFNDLNGAHDSTGFERLELLELSVAVARLERTSALFPVRTLQ